MTVTKYNQIYFKKMLISYRSLTFPFLGREYEDAVRRKFGDMYVGSVHVDSPQAKAKFNEVLDEAFQDGKYSWGRIAGEISNACYKLLFQAFTKCINN